MPIPENRNGLNLRSCLLAVFSGFLLTAAFPPGHLSFTAWIALIPLLKGIENRSGFSAFNLGVMAGLAHFLSLIYWIIVVLEHYGNLGFITSLTALVLLSFYLSLFTGLFSCFTSFLKDSRFFVLFMACFWVGLEYAKAHFLTGFPWCLLGYSQFKHLYIIQIADLFGVYGLSFLIVVVNGVLYRALFSSPRPTGRVLRWEIPLAAILMMGTLFYGHYRLSNISLETDETKKINAAVIQGNIDQSLKWNPQFQAQTVLTYERLTQSTFSFEPQIIVWPETSLPFFFQNNRDFVPLIFSLSKKSGATLIFGSPAFKRTKGHVEFFNRAYMIEPRALDVSHYDKIHLVPFGEYVPLKKFLPFIHRLVQSAGDFTSGASALPLKTDGISVGVLICFEGIFPELARDLTANGATLLVNLTNDAWYGMTSAPFQHLSMAVFRCVENRRPMLRAANTGISAFIGPDGRIQETSDLFSEAVLMQTISIPAPKKSLYTRIGDIFAAGLLVITFLKIFWIFFQRRRARKNGHTSLSA